MKKDNVLFILGTLAYNTMIIGIVGDFLYFKEIFHTIGIIGVCTLVACVTTSILIVAKKEQLTISQNVSKLCIIIIAIVTLLAFIVFAEYFILCILNIIYETRLRWFIPVFFLQ